MQQIKQAIIHNAWVRAGILGVIIAAVTWALLPNEIQSTLVLKAAHYVGWFAPAILIGGAVWWVTFNKTWWLWTTGGLMVLSFVILAQQWR